MNRAAHLIRSGVMLGLAAFAGVALAKWRNHADFAKHAKRTLATTRAAPASGHEESSGISVDVVVGEDYQEDLLEDAGVYFRTRRPTFSLANEQGQVLDQGLEQAGVPLDKKDEIQAALDIARTSIFASMKKRVKPDERNSDSAKGIRAYLIPAQMGLREEILGKLESEFTRICGDDKGALLTQALHPGGRFGYFGRQSISVRILTGSQGQGQQAEFYSFDPMSGRKVLSHTVSDAEQFRTYFGDAIEW